MYGRRAYAGVVGGAAPYTKPAGVQGAPLEAERFLALIIDLEVI